MKIACLQFAPQVGDVDNNLNRADAILNKANPQDLDLLVLPELAVTGYNFRSLRDISPFLEPTGAGISSVWARTTALKYNCTTIVGYPEKMDVSRRWPTSPEYYNSALIVNQDGDTIGHYRKTHLYYTDETWALEGPGFFKGHLPGITGNVAMGICMDINPYKFEAPWHAFEFAFHVLESNANVVILSMAWLTTEDFGVYSSKSSEPDLDTLTYWLTRLEPLIRAETEEEIIVIFANRTGVEDNAVYAGTSAVIGIQGGEVNVYGVLSRGAKELLVVDTEAAPYAKLVYRPEDEEKSVDASGGEPKISSDEASHRGSSNGSNASPNPSEKPGVSADPNSEEIGGIVESGRRGIPQTGYDGSPVSSGYSWRHSPSSFAASTKTSESGIHGTYEERRTTPNPRQRRPGIDCNESVEGAVPRSAELDINTEFSGLVSRLNDSPTTGEASIKRPSSTKIRNASRHRPRKSQSTNPAEQLAQSIPIGISRHEELGLKVVNKGTAPDVEQALLSPDLEKLGAELMVFEGDISKGPKRDSLICHVDEEDYAAKLLAKRRNSVGKKPSKPDVHADHSSPRSAKPRENHGRSHSRNKSLTESPIYPLETSERTPPRPASRGRQRSGSKTTPNGLSKKTSYSRMAANGTPPPGLGGLRGTTSESSRHNRHKSEGILGVPSPPPPRHRQDPAPPLPSKPVKYKTEVPLVKCETALPIRTTKHRKGEPRSALTKGALSSLEAAVLSPSAYISPTVEETKPPAPKFVPARIPRTPKAMILPPDYDGGVNHQSMPVPPRKQEQVISMKCLDESTEDRRERPRSAVW
ncbi:carbon-nitrogen hydrolase [Hypoxylon sp. FL0890]|nr:carbon-nitrogen hydrolase [Hypoxylon sp. FL0890]